VKGKARNEIEISSRLKTGREEERRGRESMHINLWGTWETTCPPNKN
jgi:hypothetical protein